MPLYEYQCERCHHRFELIQKFSDPAPAACPSCGDGPVAKLPSSPAIQFKGTGWYITDYAKKSGTDAGKAGSEKTDGGKEGGKDGGKDSGATPGTAAKSDAAGAAPAAPAAPAPAAKKD